MYDYYREKMKGQLSQEQFDELVPYAQDTLKAVAKEHVPYWRLAQLNLEEERFYKAICYQIEFLNSVGGVSSLLSANMPSGITKIETSGFTIDYRSSSKIVGGLPISPMALSEFLTALRLGGFTYIGVGL